MRSPAIACALLAAASVTGGALAQTWSRTIQVVIPLSAGNAIDVVGRVVMEQVSKQVGQPVYVENRLGAGGTIGANMVAKAAPDGHTLLVYSSSFSSAAALYSNLPYDTVADFTAVAPLGIQPSVLVVPAQRPFKTVKDLVDFGKANPGKLNFASAGAGAASHFAAERLRTAAGFQAQHVPFRGPNEALTQLLAGEIDFYFLPLAPALPLIREGRIRALAVSTDRRTAALPDVPSVIEAGLPGATYNFWTGLFVASKTPAAIVDRLHAETARALQDAGVQERLQKLGVEPLPMTQASFAQYFKADVEATRKLVTDAGIPPAN
jgi:tripartite-type tricarboxylate transporter receptor subunit TctC